LGVERRLDRYYGEETDARQEGEIFRTLSTKFFFTTRRAFHSFSADGIATKVATAPTDPGGSRGRARWVSPIIGHALKEVIQ
jgi:hypothetical protein